MIKKNRSLLWRDTLVCTIATTIVAGLLLMLFIHVHILDPISKAFEDFRFSDIYTSQNFKEKAPTNKIILVNIGNHDRADIAIAVNKIAENKPKVIGLDIIFQERKDPIKDSILHFALQKNKNVVSAYIVEEKSLVVSNPYFKTTELGFINLNQQDAVVRDFTGIKKTESRVDYAFPVKVLEVAGLLNDDTKQKLEHSLKINYTGNQNSFLTFELNEIQVSDKIPALENAIVLFGYMGSPTGNKNDILDKHFTPLNSKFAGKSIPDMYGIVVHANIIKMLMEADYIYKAPKFLVLLLAFLCCFVTIFFALLLHKKSAFTYHLLLKILELAVSVIFLYIAFLLMNCNVDIQIEPIIILCILGLEVVILYDHLLHYLQKRWKWESYLLK